MLFHVDIDGIDIPVQIVKRGDKVYYRVAPFAFHEPSEKQKEVRRTLAQASTEKYGSDLETINQSVGEAFQNWYAVNPLKESVNALEQALSEYFGNKDVESVKSYYQQLPRDTARERYNRRKAKINSIPIPTEPPIRTLPGFVISEKVQKKR